MWMKQQEQVYLHPQQQSLHPGIIGTVERTHYHHHHDHHRSTAMDLPGPSNPRAARNMAEKQRRDNHNTNIMAMGKLLPIVAESPRKMDKISILRLATAFLRSHYTLGYGKIDFLPRELAKMDLEQYIVDNLIESGGFFIVVTTTGKIVYVSMQVQEHLGHTQADLLGHSLYNFVHPKDHDELTKNLVPDEMQGAVSSSLAQITDSANDNSSSSEDSASLRNERKPFREQRRSFQLRMLHRTASRREHAQYECIEISGMLRLADTCKNLELNGSRTRYKEVGSTSNDIIFVGVARLLMKRPITEISIIDANKDEYVTRHLVDGRIIYCDHRVSVVAGYLSEEVSGLSAFGFMHKDDFRWTMIALRQMYDRAETCGSSCYRLLSKPGEFIYLRTHGYLEFDKDTQTVESFVCINTLVSEEEGIQLVKQMKKRYSATVSDTRIAMIQDKDDVSIEMGTDSQQSNSKSSVGDPSQVEDAVTHLVSDLSSSSVSENSLTATPVPNEQFVKAAIVSQHLPPAAAQASKIGIKKIDHYLVVQGKGNRTPKQEQKAVTSGKQIHEEGNSRPSGKSLPIGSPRDAHDDGKDKTDETTPGQVGSMIVPNDLSVEPCVNVPHIPGTSRLDDPLSIETLNPAEIEESIINVSSTLPLCDDIPCDIKVENVMDVFDHAQDPLIEYPESVPLVDDSIVTDSRSSHQYPLKRIYSDEDVRTICNKKRHIIDPYTRPDTNDEEQNVPYCRPYGTEEFPEITSNYSQYNNMNSQLLRIAESPNSTLDELTVDYQEVDPDLIVKMIFENTFNDAKVQIADHNQAINKEIRRTHLKLKNSMALQESQLDVLARDLKNPALQAQRGSLTPLQAEHNRQKQMLESLQQDHHNIQMNIKQNIGV
ncbi:circadian locomoter output cycles protein kaput-like isoform X1 [Hylaeus volcanicus]|uniref:circadian locomoter output cycles protein kaput-like isoform X1 n=1 Tax=Hylaeus volcanicus TaxID=313075 RepID=UPI0023B7D463|nr:circadian locomoter output cycles protein kaput-like isoform X1 [Hylaeus volcanicus]